MSEVKVVASVADPDILIRIRIHRYINSIGSSACLVPVCEIRISGEEKDKDLHQRASESR
jgi:hypothetical protein